MKNRKKMNKKGKAECLPLNNNSNKVNGTSLEASKKLRNKGGKQKLQNNKQKNKKKNSQEESDEETESDES